MRLQTVLILGCGYVGEKLACACMAQGMQVVASTRSAQRAEALQALGIEAHVMQSPADLPATLLASVHAIVDSIPLSRDAHGMYASQLHWLDDLAGLCPTLQWAGYLSTTGVYGDAAGAWVDESWSCQPSSVRGSARLAAEKCWLQCGLPAEVFRLAGIYGPERNILARLKAGSYQAVAWHPPHYSSRIHVDDIVASLMAAMAKPRPGRIVNVADDMPVPHADYVCELASMMGAPAPEILNEQEGAVHLSPTALAFFQDNKRVSNRVLHDELLASLAYPDFRTGMAAIVADGAGMPVVE